MAKKSRKLSLKKETLRALHDSALEGVAGGTLGSLYVGGGINWLIIRNPIGGAPTPPFCASYAMAGC